jgi:hypothetical protein
MAGFIPLYVFLFVLAVLGIWAVYRVLGGPSQLPPADYRTVIDDLIETAERERARLLAALDSGQGDLGAVASSSRKIFQTGYYQSLRLRPSEAADAAAEVRDHIRRACEACDWAGRMVGGETANNPLLLGSARSLLEAAGAELERARAGLLP